MTYVPDDNFEQKLIDLGLDTPPLNDSVPTKNIDTLKILVLSLKGIKDLTGIEDFKSLEYLYCFYNTSLTRIDLSNNPNLKILDCRDCAITSLNLKGCSNLNYLNCHNNLLEYLDVSDCSNLDSIDCSRNRIINLDVTNSPNLKKISCGMNQLTTLDVSKNPLLYYLDCWYTKLSSLDVSRNQDLEFLNCSNAFISKLDLSKNLLLSYLKCSKNNLTSLDVSQNIALKSLTCSENQISKLDLSNNPQLKTIICDNNQIVDLDLSKNAFVDNVVCSNNKLKSLNLKNNNNYIMRGGLPLRAVNNPELYCIQVDDSAWSARQLDWEKDSHAYYSEDCGYVVKVEEIITSKNISFSPNPASQYTLISYSLPEESDVVIEILDIFGNRVRTLSSGIESSGKKNVEWNLTDETGKQVASGKYFCRLKAGNEVRTEKITVVR